MSLWLLLTTFLVWSFGQLLVFNIPQLSFPLYLLDALVALCLVVVIGNSSIRQKTTQDPLFKPLIIFLFIAGFSLLVNSFSQTLPNLALSFLYLFRLVSYPSVYFLSKTINKKSLSKIVLISLIIFCLIAIGQYLLFPDMRFLKLVGFDDHYYRLIGSLFDPNFTGAILAGAALYFLAKGNHVSSIPFILLLALTFSRASYLCFGVGLLLLLVLRKKYSYILFLIVLGALIYLAPKPFGEGVNLTRTFSIISRLTSWHEGWKLFLERPVLGWGYNTLRSITGERFQIDNSFIFILATTGILGFVSFLNLLYRSLRLVQDKPSLFFVIAILLHSFFNNSLFYIWIYLSYWVSLSLTTGQYKQPSESSR